VPDYTQFHFHRLCADDPAEILELVEDMLRGLKSLPENAGWFVRRRPEIIRHHGIGGSSEAVSVACRITVDLDAAKAPSGIGWWSWSTPDGKPLAALHEMRLPAD
jgi:hypothetical protein